MTSAAAIADPSDPGFDLPAWEESRRRRRQEAAAEQARRDAAWAEDARTRLRAKDGPSTAPGFVSVPVPDPAPGAPTFVLVRDPRG